MSTDFATRVESYKAGVRERAALAGFKLGAGIAASRADQRTPTQDDAVPASAAVDFFASALSAAEAVVDKPSSRRLYPWVLLAATLPLLSSRSVPAAAARHLAEGAHVALAEAGIPSFNARIINEKLERLIVARTEDERRRLCDDIREAIIDIAQRMDMASQKQRQQINMAFAFGVVFLGVLAYAALRQGALIDDRQFYLLRVVVAVAAAGVAATIPGFLHVEMKAGSRLAIRAGGALAVFVLVYQLNPPDLVHATVRAQPQAEPSTSAPSTAPVLQPAAGGTASAALTTTTIRQLFPSNMVVNMYPFPGKDRAVLSDRRLKLQVPPAAKDGIAGYCWELPEVDATPYKDLVIVFESVEVGGSVQAKLESEHDQQPALLSLPAGGRHESKVPMDMYSRVASRVRRICFAIDKSQGTSEVVFTLASITLH